MDTIQFMNSLDNEVVDLVFTSPPYNVSYRNDLKRYTQYDDNLSDEDYINWTINIFKCYEKILTKNGVICYNVSYSVKNPHLIYEVVSEIIKKTNFTTADTIVWKKRSATPNSVNHNRLTRICEFVFVFVRKSEIDTFFCNKPKVEVSKNGQQYYGNIFNFIEADNNDLFTEEHNATFSSELARWIIKLYSKQNSLIMDNFMGTGTTAVASIQTGRRYIGCEISEEYIKIANQRLQQKTLLDAFSSTQAPTSLESFNKDPDLMFN